MKTPVFSAALAFLAFAGAARAQWQTTSYALKGGWNAIYLHGDPAYAVPATLFSAGDGLQVEEVWRWNPNPSQAQFTTSPLLPSGGTPEWSKWVRGATGNTLTQVTGQNAYLIKCAGTVDSSYSVPIVYRPLPPASTWVRNGANLLGFPSALKGGGISAFLHLLRDVSGGDCLQLEDLQIRGR